MMENLEFILNENLYPITYKGKKYYEEDCDEIFSTFYNNVLALNENCGVYISDGMWIYPDGTMEDES